MNLKKFIMLISVGIGIGILIAPRKGSETRERLCDRFDDLSESFDQIVDTAREKINTVAEKVKDKTTPPAVSGINDDYVS